MKRLLAILMTSALLVQVAPTVSAKSQGDWNAVKALVNDAIAVKTKAGKTHYGLLQAADDSAVTIRLAGSDDMTSQTINVRRDEVAKVWRARLRFGEDNVGKAAWIGAGAGLGVALVASAIKGARGSSDPPTWAALYPFIGAGGGAVAGMFWKKKHKKQELVYGI